jgi:hypothetical protein
VLASKRFCRVLVDYSLRFVFWTGISLSNYLQYKNLHQPKAMPVKLFQRLGACFGRAPSKIKKGAVPKDILELRSREARRRSSASSGYELGPEDSHSPGESSYDYFPDHTPVEPKSNGLSEVATIIPVSIINSSLNDASMSFDVSRIEDEMEEKRTSKTITPEEPMFSEIESPIEGAEINSEIDESALEIDLSVNASTVVADTSIVTDVTNVSEILAQSPPVEVEVSVPNSARSVKSATSVSTIRSYRSAGSERRNIKRRHNSEVVTPRFDVTSRGTYSRKCKHHQNLLRQEQMRRAQFAEKQKKELRRQELFEQQELERQEETKTRLQHWRNLEKNTYQRAYKQHVDNELAYFKRLVSRSTIESIHNVTM